MASRKFLPRDPRGAKDQVRRAGVANGQLAGEFRFAVNVEGIGRIRFDVG
jgi:hypothetical protein